MKQEKLILHRTWEDLVRSEGGNPETIKAKMELVDAIRGHCKELKISQRQLANMVPGMSQDRIWRIFNGISAGMTIDKLMDLTSALKIKVTVKARPSSQKPAALAPPRVRRSSPRSGSRRRPRR